MCLTTEALSEEQLMAVVWVWEDERVIKSAPVPVLSVNPYISPENERGMAPSKA